MDIKEWNRIKEIITKMVGKVMTKKEFESAILELTPREQKILKMRFGLEDGVTHTLEEVGNEFGVTRERIRQIEFKAYEKMRNHPKVLK